LLGSDAERCDAIDAMPVRNRLKIASVIAIGVALLMVATPVSARRGSSSSSPPALRISDIQLFTPNGSIDAVPADTAVGVRISVRNGTDQVARNVRLELNPPAGVTMPYPNADYGTIAAGEARFRSIGFEISAEQCNAPVLHIFGTLRSTDSATPIVVDVNTDCPGPRFFVRAIRFRGGNGDPIADPGERLEVFVRLENEGHDVATGIRGTLEVQSADLDVIEGSASWPDITPGQAAENKDPFVIQLSQEAPRRAVCGTPIVGATPTASAIPPTPTSTERSLPSIAKSPGSPAAVGFDAIVRVHTGDHILNANFSSGYPCFSEIGSALATNDTSPVPAPSSRIPVFLIVVGIGVAVAIVVRARLSR